MQSLSLIYSILLLGFSVNPIFSYVVDRYSSSSSNQSEEVTETPPRRQHVSRISRPGELGNPTISELTQFIGATEFDDNRLGAPNYSNSEQLAASSNINKKANLSFNDLLTLLAVWHLASEFNNYDVKVDESTPTVIAVNNVQK